MIAQEEEEERMPVEVKNQQQEIMQMLRQFRLDQELENMDFIEIRNRFKAAFKLLTICLNNRAPEKGGLK